MPGFNPFGGVAGLGTIAGVLGNAGKNAGDFLGSVFGVNHGQPGAPGGANNGPIGAIGGGNAGSGMGADVSGGGGGGGMGGVSGNFNTTPAPSNAGMQPAGLNSTVNSSTADPATFNLSQGTTPTAAPGAAAPSQSDVQSILNMMQSNPINPMDYVGNVNNEYKQIYSGLDNQLANEQALYGHNNQALSDIYNSSLAATAKQQAITDAARGSQGAALNDLSNREVGQAQQASNAQDAERMAMINSLTGGNTQGQNQSKLGNIDTIPVTSAQNTIQAALASGRNNAANVQNQAATDKADNNMWASATANQEAGAKQNLLMSDNAFQQALGTKRQGYNQAQAQDLMNAQTQTYQAQLARVGVLNSMYQFEKTYGTDQLKAMLGTRGIGSLQQQLAQANYDNAKANSITGNGGSGTSAPSSLDTANQWALQSGLTPQQVDTLGNLTAKAGTLGLAPAGTNPTVDDILKSVSSDPAFAANGLQNMLPNARQYIALANAPKSSSITDPAMMDALNQLVANQ